jgi:hypothetical protein
MTGAEISICLGMPLSTVSAVLCRIGLGKLSRLEPLEPPNRYERARPGELVDVDDDEQGATAAGFLRRAVGFYASYGITVERVMSDNGSCYVSAIHAVACRLLGLRHLRTRPYRPAHQRQGEAIHPHHARRPGRRRDLRDERRTHRRP